MKIENKKAYITVRIEKDIIAQFKTAAEFNNDKMSKVIQNFVYDYIRITNKKKDK